MGIWLWIWIELTNIPSPKLYPPHGAINPFVKFISCLNFLQKQYRQKRRIGSEPKFRYLRQKKSFMELPNDPMMLFSTVNMYLRDRYRSLDELCSDLDINRRELEEKLLQAGFEYSEKYNKFW